MALTLARQIGKIGGLLRATPPCVQSTANYARKRRKRQQAKMITRHPTYIAGGLYEPDYLEILRPPTEQYTILDIDLVGYDFPVLEKYQKYLFKKIRDMDLEYLDAYGHPNQVTDVELLKPKSEIVQEIYHLRSYKRTVQLSEVPVYKIGLLIDVLYASAPPGVTFTIVPHDAEREENRYVPDVYKAETQRELENLLASK